MGNNWMTNKPTRKGVYWLRAADGETGLRIGVTVANGKLITTLWDDYQNNVPVAVIPDSWQWKVCFFTEDETLIWNQ